MFKKILVGVDGSAGSMRALEVAAGLARQSGATLHTLTVIDRDPRFAATVGEVDEERATAESDARQVQERARQVAIAHGLAIDTLSAHGHTAQALVERTKSGGYDLLVLGASGHSGVWGPFLGSTTDKVSRHAAASVLIVR
ncbi:MAG: universal stress protein [Thermomicrobiales bacterium]